MILPKIEFDTVREQSVYGRYISPSDIDLFLEKDELNTKVEILGKSVQGRDIKCLTLGTGNMNVLIWSHMHGNEGTTTKAVLDLVNTLLSDHEESALIGKTCTVKIIPMLNPDGALQYSRENANGIDLNRDAQKLSQPESKLLRELYDRFKPEFCLNMHDQRSIYSAGTRANPASLSFLAPAADENISITNSRKKSMLLVAAMNEKLKPVLGNKIGRYDDSFNLDCVGDTFQALGTPTVLFEAGHYPGDYEREITRQYIWAAMMIALHVLSANQLNTFSIDQYTEIPNNEKLYYDILIRNAEYLGNRYNQGESVGILYDEQLRNDQIEYKPVIENIGMLGDHFGHLEYDCSSISELENLRNNEELKSLLF